MTIDHGHKNGKSFGFREMRRAMKLVEIGKLEIVTQNRFTVRGRRGGLEHGYETTFRIID